MKLLAGPCVIESEENIFKIAKGLEKYHNDDSIDFYFKYSPPIRFYWITFSIIIKTIRHIIIMQENNSENIKIIIDNEDIPNTNNLEKMLRQKTYYYTHSQLPLSETTHQHTPEKEPSMLLKKRYFENLSIINPENSKEISLNFITVS